MIAATWHVVYIPGAFNSIRSFRREDYVNACLAIHFIRPYVVSIRIPIRFGAAGRAAAEWNRFAIEASLLR
jgi:hypothetical protein